METPLPENVPQPLSGVKVLDVTTYFMAPYTTTLLAQLGADVIKIESPKGDISRSLSDSSEVSIGRYFHNLNRGKRSVTLDLKSSEDLEQFHRLAQHADIVVHNVRPKAARRIGLTYEGLSEQNADLIFCSMMGYDQQGPLADMPALDDAIQAASGLAAIQGGSGDPTYVKAPLADKTVGVFGVVAILAALAYRDRTGLGQSVDVPMFETMAAFNLVEQQGGMVYDPPRGPSGYPRTSSPFRRPFQTQDGFVSALMYNDTHWREFYRIVEHEHLAEDPRFASISGRSANIDALYSMIGPWFQAKSSGEWLTALRAADIPCAPVSTVPDLLDDPQLRASGLFERVTHPTEGNLIQPALPVRFSRSTLIPAGPAPSLGNLLLDTSVDSWPSAETTEELSWT